MSGVPGALGLAESNDGSGEWSWKDILLGGGGGGEYVW